MKFKELLKSGRLDEISQATKNAYIKGASKDLLKTKAKHAARNDAEQAAIKAGKFNPFNDPDAYQDTEDELGNWKKMDKRTRGVQKAVDKSMTTEGKFVEPFSKSGKPNPNHPNFAKNKAKYDAEQKAEREANRPPKAAPKPKPNLDKIFYDLSGIIGDHYPDGDPTDYFPKYYRKHGIDYEIARKAFKKNGYKDEYDYIDKMKDDFPMTAEGVVDTTKHSPVALQKRVLDREMKKRGLTKEEVDTEQTELAQQIKDLVAAGKDREANHLRHKLNNLIDMDRIRQKNKGMKEGYGGDNTFNRSSRADWDPNMTDYQGDYGGSKNWGHREREDDERHDLDKWYLRVNGQVYSRFGKPVAWDSRALANSYGHTLQGEHPEWKILLTRSPV